ncbi:MAG: hypothetical protein EOS81_03080 [Mesorhizobium sp.]|nr:MAG: hypothetical protein EOS81_03080 [Mesorhizobium sp.]
MSALERAIWLAKLPFRVLWGALLIVNFLAFAPLFLLVIAFVTYWIALSLSYLFLPEAWADGMWAWASELYAEHLWFKAATITAFTLLCLPLLFWPSESEEDRKKREEKDRRATDDLIAAREQERATERRASQELSRLQACKTLFE